MNRLKKTVNNENTYIICIIFFLIILISLQFIVLINEDSTESDSDKEYLDVPLPITYQYNKPDGIRLTFIHNFNDSVVISWFTGLKASYPLVIYSTNEDLSNNIIVKPNSKNISSTFVYTAELVDLLPNKTYFYQIRSDPYNKREILNFTTMPTNTDHFSFLVYGDSRTESNGKTQRDERKNLAEKIMANFNDKIQFTVHTGDMVYDGLNQYQWNDYFNDTECLNLNKQGIYVEGNHELGQSADMKMYDNLPMRSNLTFDSRYYSFSYMDIGFIILVSSPYAHDYAPQTEWLNQTLIQFSQENLVNFVFLHHPLLHDARTHVYFRENWKPLIDKYNVSLIFCGHDHHYERSYPMTNSTNFEYDGSELYNYTNLNNSVYITAGGAGAPLYTFPQQPFIAKIKKAYNFVIVDVKKEVSKTTLSLETWCMPDDFGDLYKFDNITISK